MVKTIPEDETTIIDRLDRLEEKVERVRKNPLTKVYPLAEQSVEIMAELASIARAAVSNMDSIIAEVMVELEELKKCQQTKK